MAQEKDCRAGNRDEVAAGIRALKDMSFPELKGIAVGTGQFHSDADYFRTRFSVGRFLLLRPMRYRVEVNAKLFSEQPPEEGICAILAHELVHVVDLKHGNRIRRFALARLLSRGYTARFERRTDLEAIGRGYGEGLKSYRAWVYAHVPPGKLAEKRRRYFSPEEIAVIERGLREKPELLEHWRKHVPMSLEEAEGAVEKR
jgi:hypothetical protein